MSHKDVLRLLFPLALSGDYAAAIEVDGRSLDQAQARAEELLNEMQPHLAAELISGWERVCALSPAATDTLQSRRNQVVRKLRETGGLSAAYFISLAEALGYTITIDEPFASEGPHVWRITIANQPLYEFYADESCAEELLLDWESQTAAEGIFQELKPAHSRLIIAYS